MSRFTPDPVIRLIQGLHATTITDLLLGNLFLSLIVKKCPYPRNYGNLCRYKNTSRLALELLSIIMSEVGIL